MRVGPMIDGIPDDTLNRMIQKCSFDVLSRYFNRVNPFGCNYTSVPEPVYRWVTCCAGKLALNAAIAGGGATIGNTRKRLGQLSITYDSGNDATTPGDIRKELDACIMEAGNLISALQGNRVRFAVQSIRNNRLVHPMADPKWGRQPRKVEDRGTHGPYEGAIGDFEFYTRAGVSGTTVW